jgi:hypothetical protein
MVSTEILWMIEYRNKRNYTTQTNKSECSLILDAEFMLEIDFAEENRSKIDLEDRAYIFAH